jgi:hypothetical protein
VFTQWFSPAAAGSKINPKTRGDYVSTFGLVFFCGLFLGGGKALFILITCLTISTITGAPMPNLCAFYAFVGVLPGILCTGRINKRIQERS